MPRIFQAVADPAIDQNFRALERLLPLQSQNLANDSVGAGQLTDGAKELFLQLAVAADRELSFGTGTLTWTASEASATKEIAHGLVTTPTIVLPISRDWDYSYAIPSKGGTNFTAQGGKITAGNVSTTKTFDWIAIT